MRFYTTTKSGFLWAYYANILSTYDWARDPAKLKTFMENVRTSISSARSTWNYDGELATKTWKEIGGTGRLTLKGLRALPDGRPFHSSRLALTTWWPDRDDFIIWLESYDCVAAAAQLDSDTDTVNGTSVRRETPESVVLTEEEQILKRLWFHYWNNPDDQRGAAPAEPKPSDAPAVDPVEAMLDAAKMPKPNEREFLCVTRGGDRDFLSQVVRNILSNCNDINFLEVDHVSKRRAIQVDFQHNGGIALAFELDADDEQDVAGHFCLAWHIASTGDAKIGDAFGLATGGEVNPHHRRKVTAFSNNVRDLMVRLARCVICINEGKAYMP